MFHTHCLHTYIDPCMLFTFSGKKCINVKPENCEESIFKVFKFPEIKLFKLYIVILLHLLTLKELI